MSFALSPLRAGPFTIPARALTLRFARAGGPGGQNVNKVETKVELRLDLEAAGLPAEARARLREIAGSRMAAGGTLRIAASEHRERERNLEAALARLKALIAQAASRPRPRLPTRPSGSSRERRLREKRRRSERKQHRGVVSMEE